MADHSKPLTTSLYADFVTELDGRFDDLARWLDPAFTTPTNLPTNSIRWNSASNKFEKWNGSAWADLSATYALTGLTTTGNTTLGDASTDTVTVNGYMGVGGAASASAGIYVASTALSGTQQYGALLTPTGTSAGTQVLVSARSAPATAAAAYTVTDVAGFWATNATKGAGSTIANQHGLLINDLTSGTNNYGIFSAVTSGTNKWNIYASGTAANYFAGNVGIGGTSSGGKLEIINAGTVNWLLNNTTGAVQTAAYASSTKGSVGTVTNHSLTLFTNNTDRVTIDSAGNLGLGVTPSASWFTGSKVIQFGVTAALWNNGSNNTAISHNAVFGNSTTTYIQTGEQASYYRQLSGQHQWFTAPSGTAGNAITFTQSMMLDVNGDWLLGRTTSSSYRAQITGASDLVDIVGTSVSAQFHNKTANVFMIGVAAGDSIAFATNGNTTERLRIDISGHATPGADSTQNLGAVATRWANVYATNFIGSGASLTGLPAPAALSTASGSAPSYSARAWVNFNGTGTVAIRSSGNVTSITDNGVGDYTVNFTTAMPDANYSATLSSSVNATTAGVVSPIGATPTASALRLKAYGATFIATDSEFVYCAINR